MRVLLSDGSGLTSRQVATQLHDAGHAVEVLAPPGLSLGRVTRHVRRVHTVPPYGADPLEWFRAALAVLRGSDFDVLLPTQEQVAMLAADPEPVRSRRVGLPVPPYSALERLQDKVSAHRTLAALEIPEPPTALWHSPDDAGNWNRFPVYLKAPIGTASRSVYRVDGPGPLLGALGALAGEGAFGDGGVLVQDVVAGPLAMVQSVFSRGALVASHANVRLREGSGGGACNKRSVDLPEVREHLARLGSHLGWHGALSADVILDGREPVWIDVNPRLVEPGNARRAGVDLVGAMLEVARDDRVAARPPGRPGVATHQLLLAVLGAAEHERRRRPVLRELVDGLLHRGPYTDSHEELTPAAGDVLGPVPLLAVSVAVLLRPAWCEAFSHDAVAGYALTPTAWRAIRGRAAETGASRSAADSRAPRRPE